MKSFPISLIIPIYKTEAFIEKCIESVCNQTLTNFEIILINDCSPDNSLSKALNILEKYPHRKAQTQVIDLTENVGIGKVRELAINKAQGEYIASVDSDDYLAIDALKLLYEKAKSENADIVIADFFIDFGKKKTRINQNFTTHSIPIVGQLLCNLLHGSYCNKIYNRNLLSKITFLQGIDMQEDFNANVQLFIFAQKIVYLDYAVLFYNHTNSNSYTKLISEKSINDILISNQFKYNFLKKYNKDEVYTQYINFHKLISKSILIRFSSVEKRKTLLELYPEAYASLPVFPKLPIYAKLINWASSKHWLWGIQNIIRVGNFIKKII